MDYVCYMKEALTQAQRALDADEFPVGCVIADENRVLASGARQGTAGGRKNEIDHAEMLALRELYERHPGISKEPLTLFCTMEPCLMCFGAILLSGIGTLVYAYEDAMGGGTRCSLSELPPLYRDRRIKIIGRFMRPESLRLFKSFFENPKHTYWKGSLLAQYTLEQR